MRVDKAKNIKGTLQEILSDPLQTDREIAEKIGTSHTTVQNAKKEICQNLPNDERLSKLVEGDLDLQETILLEKKRRLQQEMDKIRNNELDQWEQTALKRSQLLAGKATERKELKIEGIEELPTEKLTEAIFEKIK